jgi:phosphate/sulfate permease
MAEIREYVTGFITAVVAFLIAVSVVPILMNTVGQISGVPLLTSALVGTIVGAGLILYLLKTFI